MKISTQNVIRISKLLFGKQHTNTKCLLLTLGCLTMLFGACQKTDGKLTEPCTLGRTTDCGNVVSPENEAQYTKIEGLYIMHNLRMEMLNGRVFNYPNAGRTEKTLICFSTSGQQKAFLNDKLACVNCYTFGKDSLSGRPTLELSGVENKPCRNLLPHGIWEMKGDTLYVSYSDSIKNNVYSLLPYDYELKK